MADISKPTKDLEDTKDFMSTCEDLFKNVVAQESAKLAIGDWYFNEQQPLLIYGGSGYGKTLFATSLGAREIDTTQLRSDRIRSLLKPILDAEDGEILFFDEIHSLQPKVLEGIYKIIDKGTYYDPELELDMPIPKVRFIFATNIMDKLPVAFKNRCKFVELDNYNDKDLAEVVHRAYPDLDLESIKPIVKASKGVPRTALSMAKSVMAGLKSEKILSINQDEVNGILWSRNKINGDTGLTKREFIIVQTALKRDHISTTAIANKLGISIYDAKNLYIEPLRASNWLAVSNQGVIPGTKALFNRRLFRDAEGEE